jgi:hypothetical protein
VHLDDIPTPPAVAARPRDSRGYPALAVTPWEDGRPLFAEASTARVHICAAERRCSVCGLEMAPGPVWRVVGAEEADAIATARASGKDHVDRAGTDEPPGHRSCMLYAAVACPWLGGAAGDGSGMRGAVVGFDGFEYAFTDYVMFLFSGVREFRPHTAGEEHLALLAEAVEAEAKAHAEAGTPVPPGCPSYLLDDEDAAEQRQLGYLRAV